MPPAATPHASSASTVRTEVVLLPSVPVMPIVVISSLGWPCRLAAA